MIPGDEHDSPDGRDPNLVTSSQRHESESSDDEVRTSAEMPHEVESSQPYRNIANREDESPEPPVGWSADKASAPEVESPGPTAHVNQPSPPAIVAGGTSVKLPAEDVALFESGRKNILAAQIMALVSVFIGGVLLSSVAVIFAFIGFGKLKTVASRFEGNQVAYRALTRSGIVAIVVSCLALTLNIATMIVMYPLVVEMLQSGNYLGMFQSGAASTGGGAPGERFFG